MSARSETRLPIRMFNSVAGALGGKRRPSFEPERLMEKAAKQTGLDDFGDNRFETGLERVCTMIETESNLHPFGRGMAENLIVRFLRNRLELQQRWKDDPSILQRPIKRPIFIAAPARTGTTLLFNLLALDDRHRWLRFWETLSPSVLPGDTKEEEKAYEFSKRSLKFLDYLQPYFKRIHAMGPDEPEECIPLLSNTFECGIFHVLFGGDTYADWIRDRDLSACYQYYANQLRLLQGRGNGSRWLLKTPMHLPALQSLFATFPDALVLQTHRSPREIVPSTCNLRYAFRARYSYDVDPKALGPLVLEDQVEDVRKAMETRAEQNLDVLDIAYSDLTRDPMAVLDRIYDHLGEPMPDAMRERVQAYLDRNPKHKHGVHEYSLADFGLTESDVEQAYDFYLEHFARQAA